jgi:hypothetical protein
MLLNQQAQWDLKQLPVPVKDPSFFVFNVAQNFYLKGWDAVFVLGLEIVLSLYE